MALFDGKGLPLHLGRARRTATLAQRLMLLAKHRGCTMPGCSASAYRSQVHHANQDWKDGGRTGRRDRPKGRSASSQISTRLQYSAG